MKTECAILRLCLPLSLVVSSQIMVCAQDRTEAKAVAQTLSSASMSFTEKPLPDVVAPVISVNELRVSDNARKEFAKARKAFLEKHKTADSIAILRKTIEMAPTFAAAHFLLGVVYMDIKDWGSAEAALKEAISLNDKLGLAYLTLGSCLVEEKKFAEAEEPLLRGIETNPAVSGGYYDLARAYVALNRFSEAEPYARKAAELNPDFADSHIVLGYVLLGLQKEVSARDEFRTYLSLDPNGLMAQSARGIMNRLDEAADESDRVRDREYR